MSGRTAPRCRMLGHGRADVVVRGHIHSAYHRVLPEGVIMP
ncbi:MAG TPA: hypothetical protein VFJ45_05000 [bacterium]|nr:hypothetical protein [bacterium]